jgi:hypothetical protein
LALARNAALRDRLKPVLLLRGADTKGNSHVAGWRERAKFLCRARQAVPLLKFESAEIQTGQRSNQENR